MTRSQKRYLNAEEVAELASLLDEAPRRIGLVDEVLQAAAEGRGMTLSLDGSEPLLTSRCWTWLPSSA